MLFGAEMTKEAPEGSLNTLMLPWKEYSAITRSVSPALSVKEMERSLVDETFCVPLEISVLVSAPRGGSRTSVYEPSAASLIVCMCASTPTSVLVSFFPFGMFNVHWPATSVRLIWPMVMLSPAAWAEENPKTRTARCPVRTERTCVRADCIREMWNEKRTYSPTYMLFRPVLEFKENWL